LAPRQLKSTKSSINFNSHNDTVVRLVAVSQQMIAEHIPTAMVSSIFDADLQNSGSVDNGVY
jgi:hypothetical protein